MEKETFSRLEVIHALESFLEFGEQSFEKCHQGYFSGGGFAARCLRRHLEVLKEVESLHEELNRAL